MNYLSLRNQSICL